MSAGPEFHQERRAWSIFDTSGRVLEHFDMIWTWARLPGLGVWVLISSIPYTAPAGVA